MKVTESSCFSLKTTRSGVVTWELYSPQKAEATYSLIFLPWCRIPAWDITPMKSPYFHHRAETRPGQGSVWELSPPKENLPLRRLHDEELEELEEAPFGCTLVGGHSGRGEGPGLSRFRTQGNNLVNNVG